MYDYLIVGSGESFFQYLNDLVNSIGQVKDNRI
jgi:hypothetical protein